MRLTIQIECNDESEVYKVSAALARMTEVVGGCTGQAIPNDIGYGQEQDVAYIPKELLPVTPDEHCVDGVPAPLAPPVTIRVPAAEFGITATPPKPPIESLQVFGPTPPPPPPHVEVIEDDDSWPAPPGSPSTPTTDLDSAGIPWDARIHAGSKARMKADNTWKLKPGVDKALVEQVKAELLGVQAVPVPPAPPVTLADAAAVSAVLQAPPASVSNCPGNFAELIKEVTTRITAGTMTADQVNAACVTVGLQMCNQLAARQDLNPAVWSVLTAA